MYRFNDYLTGHNPTNFANFRHTPEQITHRNERIRQAYQNPELKQKISHSVEEAFKDPIKKKNLSNGQKRGWDNINRKRRQLEHALRLLAQGKIGPRAPFKVKWVFNPFTGIKELMHSGWETAFLEKCISEQYPVTKKHDLRIPYIDVTGVERIYIPDFIGLEEKVVFEVKGWIDDNVALKRSALDQWAQDNDYKTVFVDYKSS